MKNSVKAGLAIGLALILAGCNQAVAPAYSPDGNSFAYVKSHSLVLNHLGHEQTIFKGNSDDVFDDVAWSPDGEYLAWSTEWRGIAKPGRIMLPNITRIRNVRRGTNASIRDVGRYLAWLNGDLVAVDERGSKTKLVTLDPDSAQVRSEADINEAPGPMTPSAGGHELYIAKDRELMMNLAGSGGGVTAFDGLHSSELKGSGKLTAIPLGQSDSAFVSIPGWLPQRSFTISRRVGDQFIPFATPQIPERLGRNLGVTGMVGSVVVSADAKVIVASILVLSGSRIQEEKLLEFSRHHKLKPKGNPRAVETEVNRLTHNMKTDEIIYEWSPRFQGELGESADAGDFGGISLDPAGKHLAYASDKGLRIFKIR